MSVNKKEIRKTQKSSQRRQGGMPWLIGKEIKRGRRNYLEMRRKIKCSGSRYQHKEQIGQFINSRRGKKKKRVVGDNISLIS